eukprot:7897107-Pyramimonas_sp.AAC.1
MGVLIAGVDTVMHHARRRQAFCSKSEHPSVTHRLPRPCAMHNCVDPCDQHSHWGAHSINTQSPMASGIETNTLYTI